MMFRILFCILISAKGVAQKDGRRGFYDSCRDRWHLNVTASRVQSIPYTKDSISYFAFVGKNMYWFPRRFLDSLLKHNRYASDKGMEKYIRRFDAQNVLK